MREKTVPFSERELGVDRAEDGNKVIFECANDTFSGVDVVSFGGHAGTGFVVKYV